MGWKLKLYLALAAVLGVIGICVGLYLVADFSNTAQEYVDAVDIGIQSRTGDKTKFYLRFLDVQYENKNEPEKEEPSIIPEPPSPIPVPPEPTPEPQPEGGEVVDFTKNGYSKYCYTFMAWQKVKSPSSRQYRWRKMVYPDWNDDSLTSKGGVGAFNAEGFGVVGDRYVVAVADIADGGIGAVGQKLDVYLDNGLMLKCIVGDIKSKSDSNWTKWGHLKGGDTMNTIEFVVDYNTWYNPLHENPGNKSTHPEWKGNVTKIIRYPNEYKF